MAASDVKILGYPMSPYFNRVQIALNLKSVNYEFVETNYGEKSEILLKYNPVYKKIPVLIHNDKPICESMIIVQYIDQVWNSGPSIIPSDPYDRAIARFWATYIDDKWNPAMREMTTGDGEEVKRSGKERVEEGLLLLEDAFVKCSKGGEFFGGENIGYIDIAMGSVLGWLKAREKMVGKKIMDEKKTPCLVKWVEKFLSHDAIKGVFLETDKLVEAAIMIQAKAKASSSN